MREIGEALGAWNSFYVMIGSSAAALTGLMFVVITLVSDDKRRATDDGVSTFSTPTVVHFCCALLTCAIMSAPFRSFVPIAILLAIAGGAGAVYVVQIGIRTATLKTYQPDLEDWCWFVAVPFVAYVALTMSACALPFARSPALYGPAAAVTLLIFAGIHNAWDVVTFLATGKAEETIQAHTPNEAAPP